MNRKGMCNGVWLLLTALLTGGSALAGQGGVADEARRQVEEARAAVDGMMASEELPADLVGAWTALGAALDGLDSALVLAGLEAALAGGDADGAAALFPPPPAPPDSPDSGGPTGGDWDSVLADLDALESELDEAERAPDPPEDDFAGGVDDFGGAGGVDDFGGAGGAGGFGGAGGVGGAGDTEETIEQAIESIGDIAEDNPEAALAALGAVGAIAGAPFIPGPVWEMAGGGFLMAMGIAGRASEQEDAGTRWFIGSPFANWGRGTTRS